MRMASMKGELLFTCEHGGNQIPPWIRSKISIPPKILESHRGWDPGTYDLARYLSKSLKKKLFYNLQTRLLVDYNRSLQNFRRFSSYSKGLDPALKLKLDENHQLYRADIVNWINESQDIILHIAVHSFTPVLNGEKRKADIGLLFDPSIELERRFAAYLKSHLKDSFIVRYNYPYLGKADGLATWLRRKFPKNYAGVELEVNQDLFKNKSKIENLKKSLVRAFNLVS